MNVPFVYTAPMTNGCEVQCSYDLVNWYDGEGIVWQKHMLSGPNGEWEVLVINLKENPKCFFRVVEKPLNSTEQ